MASFPMRRYRVLAIATAAAAYALVVLGGLVRITGAGLACPDWPLCHGLLVPPLEGRVLIEYAHRLAAAMVSVLVLVTTMEAFRVRRGVPRAGALSLLVIALLAIQIIVGGLTVRLQLTPTLVAIHLGIAMLFLAGLLTQVVVAMGGEIGRLRVSAAFRGLAVTAAGATYVMILIGGYVGSSAAALACPDLPFCRGAALVTSGWAAQVHMLHRVWALVVIVLVLATAKAASHTGIRLIAVGSSLAAGLALAQIAVGLVNVITRLAPVVQGAHLALAAALFGTLVVLSALPALAGEPVGLRLSPARGDRRALPTIAGGSVEDPAETLSWTCSLHRPVTARAPLAITVDYLALMKPRIILLLLITTCTTMIVASPQHVAVRILLLTVLGGTLAAGSANAFNMYIDRDIDAVMRRTCLRPVPSGRLRPAQALGFGAATGLLSIAVMAWGVNTLSAALSTSGILFYVGVYTLWLKRTTPQNIVIGGAAGAVPPLVGWAAATGHIGLPAVALFAIVFLWTPPHFWALALGKADDYRAARVPMLPVARGDQETRRQIFIYALALTAATLLLYAPLHTLGRVYLAAAALLDGLFIFLAGAVLVKRSPRAEMSLFGYSILYLGLLFAAMVLDRLIGV